MSSEWEKAWAAVSLASGEKIAGTFGELTTCEIVGGEYTRKKGLFDTEKIKVKSAIRGYFLASNHRLLFVERRGILNFSFHCRVSIPYEKIAGVSTGGWWTRYLAITDSDGVEYRILNISKERENELKNLIEMLIHQRKMSLQKEEKSKKIQVVVDFSFLKSVAEKGGIVLTTVSCPSCGGQVELPKSGNLAECKYCGKQVYATDIFEKIKHLVSDLGDKETS